MGLMSADQEKAFELQRKEFDAMGYLAQAWRALEMTAIVEDDYPLVRGRYESAVNTFIRARDANTEHAEKRSKNAEIGGEKVG
jgi:hypothetical protein